ncbi:MAG: hypothetical protein U1E05_02150, partial [Patescibacteria group bacterium]|nr:hypothetical protein [Patescibacteria group bacterium]
MPRHPANRTRAARIAAARIAAAEGIGIMPARRIGPSDGPVAWWKSARLRSGADRPEPNQRLLAVRLTAKG